MYLYGCEVSAILGGWFFSFSTLTYNSHTILISSVKFKTKITVANCQSVLQFWAHNTFKNLNELNLVFLRRAFYLVGWFLSVSLVNFGFLSVFCCKIRMNIIYKTVCGTVAHSLSSWTDFIIPNAVVLHLNCWFLFLFFRFYFLLQLFCFI